MKIFLYIIFFIFTFTYAKAEISIKFYINAALENNLRLNAERENNKSIKQNINISRSEFLPSLSINADQTSSQSFNRTNQSGAALPDSNSDNNSKSISVDQKIFQGFKGYNSLKKSELEVKKAGHELNKIKQETILDTAVAYFEYIFNNQNEKFNSANINLFERQVESDSARAQKGEITLTDLAQSESSLAGAKANFIKAETDLLTSKINFERITREKAPDPENLEEKIDLKLPKTLQQALNQAKQKNLDLLIAELDFLISEKELKIEKAKLSPSASLNFSKSENNDFSSAVDKVDEESVKATITWPIIKGGKNLSSIKKSSLNKEKMSLMLQDAKSKVTAETTNAWSKFQSSGSVLIATEAQLKAAEIANEGITLEYDSGNTRTTLDVIQSRSLLLDARITHAKAERDFIISKFELAFQIGSLSLNSINIL